MDAGSPDEDIDDEENAENERVTNDEPEVDGLQNEDDMSSLRRGKNNNPSGTNQFTDCREYFSVPTLL